MKTCSKCKRELDLTEFPTKVKATGALSYWCKDCHREASREAQNRNRDYYRNWLATHPCVDCGDTDPLVLQFDHIEMRYSDRRKVVSGMGGTLKKLMAEIALCEIRCANCHVRRTRKQLGYEW
jgi:hypothetical protein